MLSLARVASTVASHDIFTGLAITVPVSTIRTYYLSKNRALQLVKNRVGKIAHSVCKYHRTSVETNVGL